MRNLTATLAAPILRITGYRFDKSWRHAQSGFKHFAYTHLISTVSANLKADGF